MMMARCRQRPILSVLVAILALVGVAATTGAGAARRVQEAYDPLVTTLGTRAFDVEYELWYYINVLFESEVRPTEDGYEYRYRLTNKGDSEVRVEWRALENSAFGEAVDDIEELRMGSLEAGTVSEWLVLTSTAAPQVRTQAAHMFGLAPSGNETMQFSGPAPAYVPE